MNKFLARQRILFVATAFSTLGSMLVATTSFAQSSTGCRAYAEDYASAIQPAARGTTRFASEDHLVPLM
jgi:hypothetical protein